MNNCESHENLNDVEIPRGKSGQSEDERVEIGLASLRGEQSRGISSTVLVQETKLNYTLLCKVYKHHHKAFVWPAESVAMFGPGCTKSKTPNRCGTVGIVLHSLFEVFSLAVSCLRRGRRSSRSCKTCCVRLDIARQGHASLCLLSHWTCPVSHLLEKAETTSRAFAFGLCCVY